MKLFAKSNRKEFIKINISVDENLDNAILKGDDYKIIDDRIKDNKRSYKNESYQRFRYELSDYIKKKKELRNNIINIINNSTIKNDNKKITKKNVL